MVSPLIVVNQRNKVFVKLFSVFATYDNCNESFFLAIYVQSKYQHGQGAREFINILMRY